MMAGGEMVGGRIRVVGRDTELEVVDAALRQGRLVVVSGVAGIGKTALVRAAAPAKRRWVAALAGTAWRPFDVLNRAAGASFDTNDGDSIADWFDRHTPPDMVLVVDDVQFADPQSVVALAQLNTRRPVLTTLRAGEPRSDDVLAALAAVDGAVHIELGPLDADSAAQLCRHAGADPDEIAAIVASCGGHPLWCVLSASGGTASAHTTVRHTVGAQLSRSPPAVRTVLAALGLLGRPAHTDMLGDGVSDAGAAGLIVVDGQLATPTHPVIAEVAVGKLTARDRADLHRALAVRLADRGEAARHLEAAGELVPAAAAAREAAAASEGPARAAHLSLVARCTATPADQIAAASALGAIGDFAPAEAHAVHAALDPSSRAAASLLLAGIHRRRGNATQARQYCEFGLRAAPDAVTRLALLAERTLTDPAAGLDDELAAAVGDSDAGAVVVLAAATVALATGSIDWAALAERATRRAVDTGDIGIELDAHALLVVAAAGTGALRDAAAAAGHAAEIAGGHGVTHWATRFYEEQAWLAALADGPTQLETHAMPAAVIALALADRGEIEAAERLLGSPVSAREHAVAGCIAWWDQRDTAAKLAQRALDERGHDPIVALLAWPTLMWETNDTPASGPAALTIEAAALRETVPMVRSRSFLEAARLWETVAPRCQVRAMWASADAAVDADDRCAVSDLLDELAAVVALTHIDAIAGRSTATGRRAGLPSRRGPNSDQRLTDRETDVLRLVGQGLSTPQISRRLGLADTTVNTHIRSAIIKLGGANRRHAAAMIQ